MRVTHPSIPQRLMQRVLELPLGHPRAAGNMPRRGFLVELLLGRAVVPVAGSAARRLLAARGPVRGVAAAHRSAALALPAGADVGLALALLLIGVAAGFLALGPPEISPVLALAFVFRGTGFLQRYRDRLAAALHFAAATAAQFTVLEFVHHATHGLALPRRCSSGGSCHDKPRWFSKD